MFTAFRSESPLQSPAESTSCKPGKVLVLIPTYNEAESVCPLVDKLQELDCVDYILVVDDSSVDGTLEKLAVLQEKYDNLFVHQRPGKLGLGTALRDGFRLALKRFPFSRLVQMDGDLSHDPSSIPQMLLSRADVVVGSRYVEDGRIIGWNFYRKNLSREANFLTRTLLGLRIRDVTSGFRVYSRRAVEILVREANCGGYEFQVEAVWLAKKHGLDVEELPITFTERLRGKSKLQGSSEVKKLLIFTVKQAWRRWLDKISWS